jgi:DNA-binding CsgD family transcriptional regulator
MLSVYTSDTKSKVIELFKKGIPCYKIAPKLGIKITLVYKILDKFVSKKEKIKAKLKNAQNRKICSKEDLIKLQKVLITDDAIGNKLGVTRQRIQQLRTKWGIPIKRIDYSQRNKKIISYCKEGYSSLEIAKKVNISKTAVFLVLRAAGIKPKIKISIETIKRNIEIHNLFKKGLTGYAISKKLGIYPASVYNELIKSGRMIRTDLKTVIAIRRKKNLTSRSISTRGAFVKL